LKDLFIWLTVAFIAACGCIVSYRYGFSSGAASSPVKYVVCDNGTCTLSETVPQGIVK